MKRLLFTSALTALSLTTLSSFGATLGATPTLSYQNYDQTTTPKSKTFGGVIKTKTVDLKKSGFITGVWIHGPKVSYTLTKSGQIRLTNEDGLSGALNTYGSLVGIYGERGNIVNKGSVSILRKGSFIIPSGDTTAGYNVIGLSSRGIVGKDPASETFSIKIQELLMLPLTWTIKPTRGFMALALM